MLTYIFNSLKIIHNTWSLLTTTKHFLYLAASLLNSFYPALNEKKNIHNIYENPFRRISALSGLPSCGLMELPTKKNYTHNDKPFLVLNSLAASLRSIAKLNVWGRPVANNSIAFKMRKAWKCWGFKMRSKNARHRTSLTIL